MEAGYRLVLAGPGRRNVICCRAVRIEGASAMVAGGASGLGAATARALHAAGASVVICDLNAEKGEALAGELGERASFVEANVMEPDDVQAAVDAAASAAGGLRISVCCAGIGWAQRTAGKQGPHDLEIFHNVIKVNLIGTFNVLRLAASAMVDNEPGDEGERGVCINTASIAAFDGQIGQVAYAASKGGIVGLTLPAARDLASRGVRVAGGAPPPRRPTPGQRWGGGWAHPPGAVQPPPARGPAGGRPGGAGASDPVPRPPGAAGQIPPPPPPHRGEPDAERGDHPPR